MKIIIPGEPVAQGRPKFSTWGGRARAIDPPKSRRWKAMAKLEMTLALRTANQPIPLIPQGPVQARIVAVFLLPKSEHRKRNPVIRRQPHAKGPDDADNIAKAVFDAGNEVLYRDDSQVARFTVEKWVGAQGEEPFVSIEVHSLQEGGDDP